MIDKELAAFLEEGIAIQIGTRSASLEPNGARVVAVRVEGSGTHIVAFLPERAAKVVAPDLEANGQAALVFARPPDERSCQVKGVFEHMEAAGSADEDFVRDQWRRWLERLTMIGLPLSTLEGWDVWPCVAVRLRVAALFNQTPGPNAGAVL
jgi:Pyridoxamine 5'-phosphate oxidase